MGHGLERRVQFSRRDQDEFLESDSFSSDSDCEEEEDVTLPPPSKSSSLPLYELSSFMGHLLPASKKGLSRYYQGKSQSYTSLSAVSSLEDLPKKETPYQRKMKTCKSYAGGLDAKSAAPCRAPSSSCASLMSKSRSSGLFDGSRPPPFPVQKTP